MKMRFSRIVAAAAVVGPLVLVLVQVGCLPDRPSPELASPSELRTLSREGKDALDRVFATGRIDHDTIMYLDGTIYSGDLAVRGKAIPVLMAMAKQGPEMATLAISLSVIGLSRCESDWERASWLHGLEQVLLSAGCFQGEPASGEQIHRTLSER